MSKRLKDPHFRTVDTEKKGYRDMFNAARLIDFSWGSSLNMPKTLIHPFAKPGHWEIEIAEEDKPSFGIKKGQKCVRWRSDEYTVG